MELWVNTYLNLEGGLHDVLDTPRRLSPLLVRVSGACDVTVVLDTVS